MTRARDLAAFVSNADGDIKFDTDTLFIDSSANNVGIGTNSPVHDLQIHKSTSSSQSRIQMTTNESGATNSDGYAVAMETNGRVYHWLYENAFMQFATNNTERMRILADGGITFNGDTAAANALNDYEEGTWSPSHTGGSGSGSFSDARYTKIGRSVTIHFSFAFTSGGGGMVVGNLPFTSSGISVGIGREDAANGYGVYGRMYSSATSVSLFATSVNGNGSAYQVASGTIRYSHTYNT